MKIIRTKPIKIRHCLDCPYHVFLDKYPDHPRSKSRVVHCDLRGRRYTNSLIGDYLENYNWTIPIPDWCSLKDYKKKSVMQ